MRGKNQFFSNNEKLRNSGISIAYTSEQLEELRRCKDDPIYFIKNYVRISSLNYDESILFDMFPYQEKIVSSCHTGQKNVIMMARQMGKTVTISAYILYCVVFKSSFPVAVLAFDSGSAKNILRVIKSMFEELPFWMQPGVRKWNESKIEFENGSFVLAAATTKSGIRGKTVKLLYIDEMAFIDNNIAEQFLMSSFPVIFSGKSTKVIITSTPIGFNHFHSLWKDAKDGINGFNAIQVHYTEHPDRDSKWADDQLKLLKARGFAQEVLCAFHGSSYTLISGDVLADIETIDPIKSEGNIDVFESPMFQHQYVVIVDTSEGVGEDSSAFIVIDITCQPFRVVAKYKSNDVPYTLYPDIIKKVGLEYNQAHVLVEVNSVGSHVAASLVSDLDYPNIIRFSTHKTKGQVMSFGSDSRYGIYTSIKTKAVGCRILKTLIEERKIIIQDRDIAHELQNFVLVGKSFQADKGYHDDLVMCLVIFAYLSQDDTFIRHIGLPARSLVTRNLISEVNTVDMSGAQFYLTSGVDEAPGDYYIDEDAIELLNS